ncbi:MAG: hypothetical protein JNL21_26035 [Myxococcales bacterium]|nr:hypothetical protein [Myxococcales bacterium]
MRTALRLLAGTTVLLALVGCGDKAAPAGGSASAAAPAKSAAPKAASATPATASAAPSAAALPPRDDCPKDSAGAGTLEQPCEGKGTARMMEVKWTGKTDDKGPSFAVTNKAPKPVLYGKIAVFFYDKDGKQLEAKVGDKKMPYLVCAGSNLFSGIMKVDEKATLTFSCVKKDDVPEGTAAIEGEMVTVGFADASEKASEYFWRNKDLAPDTRPKGGVK